MRLVIYSLIVIQIFWGDWDKSLAQDAKKEARKNLFDALKLKSDTQKIEGIKKALELYPELEIAHFKLGEIYFKQGEYEKAKNEFQAEIRINPNRNPNYGTALRKLGDTYLALNDKNNAAAAYEIFLGIKRDKSLFEKTVDLYIDMKAFSKAFDALKKYRKNLTATDALYFEGYINLSQGKKQEALQLFEQALKENPDHGPAKQAVAKIGREEDLTPIIEEAQTALQNNRIDNAIKARNQIAQKKPNHKELPNLDRQIAQYYLNQADKESDIDLALSYLDNASRYDNGLPGLTQARAQLQERKKAQDIAQNYDQGIRAFNRHEWPEAIQYFNRVILENPDYKDAGQKLQHAREEQQKALAEAQKPSETKPLEQPPDVDSMAQKFFSQGDTAITQQQWVDAVFNFQSALQLKPEFAEAQTMLSYAQAMQALTEEKWALAVEKFDDVLKLSPDHQQARSGKYYALGRESANNEQWQEALSAFEAVFSIAPDYRDVQTRLELVKAKLRPESHSILSFEKLKQKKEVLVGAFVLLIIIMIAVLRSRQKHYAQVRHEMKSPPVSQKPSVSQPSEQLKTIPQGRPSHKMDRIPSPQEIAGEQHTETAATFDEALLEDQTRLITKPESPSRLLDRYELKSELGKGAMGKVYKAYDHKMERTVALKEIRVDLGLDRLELEKLKKRFRREALSAAKLSHPNIVTVFDIVESEDKCFISMEYLEGLNLSTMLNKQRVIPPLKTVKIIRQACSALYEAHCKGIVHRDIKPSNFMVLRNDHIKIVDFGVAKIANASGTLTQTGSSLGTPSYMSPEQIEGKEIDGRSDIFSLGVVFYEMLTGERPFTGESIASIVVKIIQAQPKRISAIRKNLPQELETIVNKMLEKDPNDRYQTAQDIINDLDKVMPNL